MKNLFLKTLTLGLILTTGAQGSETVNSEPSKAPPANRKLSKGELANMVEQSGILVRIKDVARFRGVRKNQIMGYGLVVGLEGTGDTKKTPFTSTLLANALKKFGTMIEPGQLDSKNVATVVITADVQPFSSPGNTLDVTITSIGDAKSLQGGFLLQSPLYYANDDQNAAAVAQGAVSIGGFNFGSGGGGSVQKNHVTVGRVPAGAVIERVAPFQIVYGQNMYIELDEGDLTTASRLVNRLNEVNHDFSPIALDGGTIQITLPSTMTPIQAMSLIEQTEVHVDIPAIVVVNERTGTIVMGGNVRLGPAVVAHGSLSIVIESFNDVSQPAPFSNGTTTPVNNTNITATEDPASIGLIGPVATVTDLSRAFQALKVSPRDVIAILQALKDQGALKARIKIQ
jgi:flagellar P-ring protein precursor FlgI